MRTVAELLDRLQQLHARTAETPLFNPVFQLSLDLSRELEADEIVERVPMGSVPAPVIYRLTEYGRTLVPLVESVRAWGRGHISRRLRGQSATPAASSRP